MARFLHCLVALGMLAAPALARAQKLDETLVVATHDADDFNIALVESLCASGVPADVTVTLTNQASPDVPVSGDDFYVWWVQTASTECSNVPDDVADQEYSETLDTALANALVGTTLYPDDFNDPPALTTRTILDQFGACEANGISERRKLCFGVDDQFSVDANTTIDQFEWVSSVIFEVDTIAPGNGIIYSVRPGDGKIVASIGMVDSGESDDLEKVSVRSRTVPTEDDGLTACLDWPDADVKTLVVDAAFADLGANRQSIEIPAENGVEVEFCVWGIDDVGNAGAPSDVAVGEARDECDFIECYPGGNPPHGYCGATGTTPTWLALFAVGLLVRRRRVP